MSSQNVTSRFCNHISIIQTHYSWKICSNYPELKLEPALGTWEDKIEHLSWYAHVVHTTAKQVISRRRKNENVFKMSKDGKCTCKACKNTVFHCQICKFVGFLLSSSSWLLKLPNMIRAMPMICGFLIARQLYRSTVNEDWWEFGNRIAWKKTLP